MPVHPSSLDLLMRLVCTCVACLAIGLDRGERGRPAGLRTTMLVGLAASLAMLEANLLLGTVGKAPNSFVNFDVMRLPLGILTGVGFIGGGAIVRRDNMVLGVTTAATLWFVTVVGLSFGGGQYVLGFAGLVVGVGVLTGLREVERRIKHDREGTLKIIALASGPGEAEIREMLTAERYRIRSIAIVTGSGVPENEFTCQLQWRGSARDTQTPGIVQQLSSRTGVVKVCWEPIAR